MYLIDYKPRRQKRKTKVTLKNETKRTVKSLIITLTLMIIVLGIVMLASTNENAQKGYSLQQTKLQNEDLKKTNASLKNKIINSTSFSNIEEKEKVENMEIMETKDYITNEDNLVN